MTVKSDPIFEEFLSPLYKKYEDDLNFYISDDRGEKFCNIQYALLQECQSDGCFEPVLWEEEVGRYLVIGFKVKGKPDYLFSDAQYSTKEDGALMMELFLQCSIVFKKTGVQVKILPYLGFGDAYMCGTL